jgi:membrane fusion protein (multidrug efflux system)
MIKRFVIAFIVLLIVFGGIFGYKAYKGYEIGMMMKTMKYPPATVSVAVSKIGSWQPYIHTIGNVTAINSVNVTTQIAGQVNGIYFKSGEFVKKNQLLVTFDDSLQLAQLKQYESQLIINKFNYLQYKKAYKKNAVSKASYIQMLSVLKQNEAEISQTKVTINDMAVKAPFSGILGIRNSTSVNLGQYIQPGANIIPLYSINPIYIDFTMPQNDLHSLKINQKVKVELDSYHKTFIGRVKTISIDVNTVSRNITARVIINNGGMFLRPGMFVSGKVFLPVIHNVITIPSTAVTYNPYGDYVYLVSKNGAGYTVKTDYITTGEQRNGKVVVLKGLKSGETVVTAGQVKLRNGIPVAINNKINGINAGNVGNAAAAGKRSTNKAKRKSK